MTTESEKFPKLIPNGYKTEIIASFEKQLLNNAPKKDQNKLNSTKKGIFNQLLVTGAVLICAAACGMPIGYSAILLPQLYNASEPLMIDIEIGSWIASIHSLATPFGSFVSGPLADRYGRKPTLLVTFIPLVFGWFLIAIAQSHVTILCGRVLAGFAVGLTGPPAQILLAEVAEPHIRGMLIGAPFVSYSLGILFVYSLGSSLHWRTAAWCGTILPILSAIAMLLIPESPVWLVRNGKLKEAAKALTWVRGDSKMAKQELSSLVERFDNEKATSKSSENFFHTLCKRTAIKPLIIINAFNFLTIFTGTYLVVFYAIDIISEFGTEIDTMQAAIVTAIVRTLCTFIFCFLLFAVKRRTILIVSGIGSGLSCLILGCYMISKLGQPKTLYDTYFAAVCIVTYIAFNTSFMVMPGIMVGELLPARIRGRVAGYIFALSHISTFGLAKIFPAINYSIKMHGLFLMFAVSSFTAAIMMFLVLPETKNKTLGEIEDYFGRNNWFWFSRPKVRQAKNDNENNI